MRKLILLIFCLTFALGTNAQNSDKLWYGSVGLNAINSQGTRSPVGKMGDWAINIPISLAVELNWATGISLEQAFTINSFAKGEEIDGAKLSKNYTYFSFDTHAKYYFGKHIFPNTEWIDFYGNAGVGIFNIDETNISLNLGGGVLVWLDKRQRFGIRAQVIGKFALDHAESGLDNNHYQTHLQAVFVL